MAERIVMAKKDGKIVVTLSKDLQNEIDNKMIEIGLAIKEGLSAFTSMALIKEVFRRCFSTSS